MLAHSQDLLEWTSIIPIGHSASATPSYIWVTSQTESAPYSIKADNVHYHFPRVTEPANPLLFSLGSLRHVTWDREKSQERAH